MAPHTQLSAQAPKQSIIFRASLEAVEKAFVRLFGQIGQKPQTVFFNNIDALRKWFKDKGGRVELPLVAYGLRDLGINYNSFNRQAMRHYGVSGGLDKTGQLFIRYYLTPVIATMRVLIFLQDHDDVFRFQQLWLTSEKLLNFIMDQSSTNFAVNLRMTAAPNLIMPDLQLDEMGPLMLLETEVALDTYAGFVSAVPTITRTSVGVYTETQERVKELRDSGVLDLTFIEDNFDIRINEKTGLYQRAPIQPSNPEL